jgi:hypothetical protein
MAGPGFGVKWAAAFALALAMPLAAGASAKVDQVILVSVDGFHPVDLQRFRERHPTSALAMLAQQGVIFQDASTPAPSDSFPGLLALLTGGTPRSTGVWYDDSYARDLASPKDCTKKGVEVELAENVDVDPDKFDTTIDPKKLPVDPAKGCAPVYPHAYLRVNTIFEVLKAAGRTTAWADKHPAYDLVQGPSGNGVDDLFVPEINAEGTTDDLAKTIAYDSRKVDAVLNLIKGLDHAGQALAQLPAVFGMNFQAVSVAQKLKGNGYQDGQARPSAGLEAALNATDAALGRMVALLDSRHLRDSTVLVVSAKHGQAPIDPAQRRIVDGKQIGKAIEQVAPGLAGQITTDDVALIWLRDQNRAGEVVDALRTKTIELAIAKIWSGAELAARFGDPMSDPRVPDIIVQPQIGVIYTKPTASKIAEHGGLGPDDRSVALLVSHPALSARIISVPVSTVQVAPTILALLGLDPQKLDAVRMEGTEVLPGLAELAVGR